MPGIASAAYSNAAKAVGQPRPTDGWHSSGAGGHHRVRHHVRNYAAPFAILLLLYAGFFKANPLLSWVPVDLTLVGAVLTLAGVLALLLSNSVPRGTGTVLALLATFLPLAILRADNPYASTASAHERAPARHGKRHYKQFPDRS